MAVSRFIGGTATWISGGKATKGTGSYGCTWITKTSLIRFSRGRFNRVSTRLPVRINLAVQALIKPIRRLKQPAIGDQAHDIPHPVEYCGTVRAYFEMRLHSLAQFRRDIRIKIIGYFPPHFDTTNLNCPHCALLFSPWSHFLITPSRAAATVDSRGQRIP